MLVPVLAFACCCVSVALCGPVPQQEVFAKECGQGQKVFTVLEFTQTDEFGSERSFLLPRCTVFEPAACTKGCRWLENCRMHPKWDDQGVYVAGAREVIDEANALIYLELFCCESLGSVFDDCEWLKPHLTGVTGFTTALADEGEIVRDGMIVGYDQVQGDQPKEGNVYEDWVNFEVCKVVSQTTRCPNPDLDQPFEAGYHGRARPNTGVHDG